MACSAPRAAAAAISLSGSFRTHLLASFGGLLADGMWRDACCHYNGKLAALMICFYTLNFLCY